MPAIQSLRESFAVYRKNQFRFLTAVVVFTLSQLIMVGALMGILMLTFIALLLTGFIKTQSMTSLYILGALGAILAFFGTCFSATFNGAFFDSCYAIYLARRQTTVDFLSYALHRVPTYSMVNIAHLFLLGLAAVPLVIIAYLVPGEITIYACSALFILASFITHIPLALAIPAVVVDNIGWTSAIGRSVSTILHNLPQFALLVFTIFVFDAVLCLIPLVGPLLILLVLLPVSDSAYLMFYRSRRKE